jgi:hypothetical protein
MSKIASAFFSSKVGLRYGSRLSLFFTINFFNNIRRTVHAFEKKLSNRSNGLIFLKALRFALLNFLLEKLRIFA